MPEACLCAERCRRCAAWPEGWPTGWEEGRRGALGCSPQAQAAPGTCSQAGSGPDCSGQSLLLPSKVRPGSPRAAGPRPALRRSRVDLLWWRDQAMEGTAPADGTEQAGSGVIKLQACAGVMASASLWWPGSPHQLLGPPAGLGAGAVHLPHHRPQTTHHVISVFPLHLGEVHAAVVGAPSLFPFFVLLGRIGEGGREALP